MHLPKTLLIFLLSLLTLCNAAAQTDSAQEVRKLERVWLDAYEQRDVDAMEKIVADDFTITFADGSMQTKAQVINSIKNSSGSPLMKFYTQEVRARAYSDTIILTGIVVSEWQQNGNAVKEKNRYTDTYVKRGGRWQVVASHLSDARKTQNQTSEVSTNGGKGRSLSKNRIGSQENPTIVIDVDEQLRNVGILNFPLKKVAQVERYVFARAGENGRVERLFIAQFESILPGIKGGYNFQVETATRIGNHDYQTNVGFFNFAQTIASNPGAEAEQTKALLNRNGLQADDDFLVARYARVASEDKRHELILFYLENLRGLGLSRAELEQGGSRSPEREKVFDDFAARALQSFKVADGKS